VPGKAAKNSRKIPAEAETGPSPKSQRTDTASTETPRIEDSSSKSWEDHHDSSGYKIPKKTNNPFVRTEGMSREGKNYDN